MPTHEETQRFRREFRRLKPEQQEACVVALSKFITDLRRGIFRKGLRVKGVRGTCGVFEMTWAPDGRATFEFGPPVRGSEVHVRWRRVGTHVILREP